MSDARSVDRGARAARDVPVAAGAPRQARGARLLDRGLVALALLGTVGLFGERVSGGWIPPLTTLAQLAPIFGGACVLGAVVAALARRRLELLALAAGALALAPATFGPIVDAGAAAERGRGDVQVALTAPRAGAPKPHVPLQPDVERSLRVLTANLGHRRSDGDTVARVLRASGADLVALQEVGPHHVAALEGLRDRYPHQRVEPRGLTGIALLARLPLGDVELSLGASGRPALRAELALGGGLIHVVTAHPSAWVALIGRLDDDARDVIALAEEAVARARGPVLLLGDLNTTEHSWIHRRLRAAGFADAWSAAGSGHGFTFPVFGRWRGLPSPPIARIDLVLHTRGLAPLAIAVGPDVGSDHLPVICDLALLGEDG